MVPICSNPKQKRAKKKLELIRSALGNRIKPDGSAVKKDYREDIIKKAGDSAENFRYEMHKDHAVLLRVSDDYSDYTMRVCTVPKSVQGLPVTECAQGAFKDNDIFELIKLPDIKEIPADLCRGSRALEGFNMGKSVEIIGENAFAGCTALKAAVIGRKVKEIKSGAFTGCGQLRTVKLPISVEFIAEDAFEGCPKAVFYCPENSYAGDYARAHNLPVVNMNL